MRNGVGFELDDVVDPYDRRFMLDVGSLSPDEILWRFNHHHLSWRNRVPLRPEAEVQAMIDDCPDQQLHKYERSDAVRFRYPS